MHGGPKYRPQDTLILFMGPPKKGHLIFRNSRMFVYASAWNRSRFLVDAQLGFWSKVGQRQVA